MTALKLSILVCAALMTLAACGKNDGSAQPQTAANDPGQLLADTHGSCSEDVLQARNDLGTMSADAIKTKNEKAVKKMIGACTKFRDLMAKSECSATESYSTKKSKISYAGGVKDLCDKMIKRGIKKTADDLKNGLYDKR